MHHPAGLPKLPPLRVWRAGIVEEQQGVRVFGVPVGHPSFVRAQLNEIQADHQTSWLLLLHCASARANYHGAREFCKKHNLSLWSCLQNFGVGEDECQDTARSADQKLNISDARLRSQKFGIQGFEIPSWRAPSRSPATTSRLEDQGSQRVAARGIVSCGAGIMRRAVVPAISDTHRPLSLVQAILSQAISCSRSSLLQREVSVKICFFLFVSQRAWSDMDGLRSRFPKGGRRSSVAGVHQLSSGLQQVVAAKKLRSASRQALRQRVVHNQT